MRTMRTMREKKIRVTMNGTSLGIDNKNIDITVLFDTVEIYLVGTDMMKKYNHNCYTVLYTVNFLSQLY